MQRLDLIKPTATNPEIAVLKVAANEHQILHDHEKGKKLVNDNHVFTKDVTDLTMTSHPTPAVTQAGDWLIVMAHLPACSALGACLSLPGGSR